MDNLVFMFTTCVFLTSSLRTLKCFEAYLKRRGPSTDYVISTEMLVMINVILDFKNQVSAHKLVTSSVVFTNLDDLFHVKIYSPIDCINFSVC